MDLLERYNQALRTTEDGTLRLLNRVLDQSFNRLIRRARIHMRAGYADPASRTLALLQEFRQLVPAYRPDRVDAYDRVLRNLMGQAGGRGLAVADALTGQMLPGKTRIDVTIPLDATVAAAAQAKGYLRKHGERFATTSAEVVSQGLAEGRPTDAMVSDLRTRLGVVKSRAEVIVRTESLRAYNEASNTYYASQGIDLVMYYATADDRSCPLCAPRAGQIYRRPEIRVPLHPRCRCYLAPWDADLAAMDPRYAASRERHATEVRQALERQRIDPAALNRASVFEQIAPVPIQTTAIA
jgi:SPP1 gp7 family putative phage head morphogenesis protein